MSWSMYLWLLVVHWFSDFVMQTNWQATNKSKSWRALTEHVLTYSTFMTIGVMGFIAGLELSYWRVNPFLLIVSAVSFFAITFATHFVTDAITSRISAKRFANALKAIQTGDAKVGQCWHDFFVIIGFDQLVHQLTLFGTLVIVLHL